MVSVFARLALAAWATALWLGTPHAAMAQSCKNLGALRYLGVTNDSSRSVWLSRGNPGNSGRLRLEAAAGNAEVDRWDVAPNGTSFHVSLSPDVSPGNGGTHRLFDDFPDCLIDTQNQKGGIVFPPIPSRPPVGVIPPVGVLPPSGVLPQLPGGISPPIGTLPPGGVTPPIGTRPPTGVTPGRPGGVSPPIGTRPPTGVTPGRPGGVTPPIGTVPPGDVTPQRPDSGAGRVGTAGQTARPATADGTGAAASGCAATPGTASKLGAPLCDPVVGPPITPGRDFGPPTLWNAWATAAGQNIEDDRFGRHESGDGFSFAAGADRLIGPGVVTGVQLGFSRIDTDTFGAALSQDTETLAIGPYFALQASERWVVNGSLLIGRSQNDSDVLMLSGSYDQDFASATLSATGQYDAGPAYARPALGLTGARYGSASYDMTGEVRGIPVELPMRVDEETYGSAFASVEIGRPMIGGQSLYVPYAELGALYEFARPNDGELLTSDLTLESPSPWSGSVRGGVRIRSAALLLDAGIGYLSLGQRNYDVIAGSLFVSYAF